MIRKKEESMLRAKEVMHEINDRNNIVLIFIFKNLLFDLSQLLDYGISV